MKTAEPTSLNLKVFAYATLIPIGVMLLAMLLKPMWRDEYWSLFFSDVSMDFSALLEGRLKDEVHPPFYYFFLHLWQKLFGSVFGIRLLSTLMLGATAIGLFKLSLADQKRHFLTYCLICLGSYWVIYFSTEIRPYIMLFCLVSLSVFMVPKFFEKNEPHILIYIAWTLCGAAMATTHYFGGLWFACLAFITGISCWQAGYRHRFFIIGLLSVIAMLPVIAWLLYSFPSLDLSDEITTRSFVEKFTFAANQYLRGVLVKTLASNPLISILGLGGVIAALRFKDRVAATLIWSAVLTSILAFVLHFTFVELIKERAFIVIMPAILFIFARELSSRQSRLMKYVPMAAVIMPLLFSGEYFKNREKIPEFQKFIISYGDVCEGAPILAYYRPSTHDDFYPMATQLVFTKEKRLASLKLRLIDARKNQSLLQTDCPVKAVAVLMPKHNEAMVEEAMTFFV